MTTKLKPKRTKKYSPEKWLRTVADRNERRADAKPLQQTRQVELAIGHHIAFDKLIKSQSGDGWYTLAGHLRVALYLANSGIGREYIPEFKIAMQALVRARACFDRGEGLVVDESGCEAISLALEIHDAQLGMATREECKAAAQAIVAETAGRQDGYEYLAEAA